MTLYMNYKNAVGKNCDVCKFWFFLDKNFNYEDYACNGCHNLLMMAFSLDNIAILRVGDAYY